MCEGINDAEGVWPLGVFSIFMEMAEVLPFGGKSGEKLVKPWWLYYFSLLLPIIFCIP